MTKIIDLKDDEIYFGALREDVIIPSKEDEDAGYDVYANFNDDYMVIEPHKTEMIPTGLVSAFTQKWRVQLKERGSTGTKGIGQRCGVIDSGFRGEWQVPITNTTEKILVICKKHAINEVLSALGTRATIYPYEKAICQAVMVEVPKINRKVASAEDIKAIPSRRGEGMLGSSQK